MMTVIPSDQHVMFAGLAGVTVEKPSTWRFNFGVGTGQNDLKHRD